MNLRLVRHATMLLEIKDKTILVDPMFSSRGTLEPIKDVRNQSHNPLVDLPVSTEELTACDAVLLTHTHRDHFDSDAIAALPKNIKIFCQPKDTEKLADSGFTNVSPVCRHLNWNGITISRTPARHGHGATALAMAPVSGFVLRAPEEPSVYITGDSVYYSETKKILNRYKPDIVICYAGEATFASGKPITMGIKDIANIHGTAPEARIAAVHMEAWNHCVLSRESLCKYVSENNLEDIVLVPSDGERVYF